MTTFVKSCLACALGLALGLWSSRAILATGAPFGAVDIGPWRVAAKAGSTDADPYTRAELERSGEIPLALGEGLQLVARADDTGRPLNARCVYRVGPHTPAARYWTLSVVDREGFPIENAAELGEYAIRERVLDEEAVEQLWSEARRHRQAQHDLFVEIELMPRHELGQSVAMWG